MRYTEEDLQSEKREFINDFTDCRCVPHRKDFAGAEIIGKGSLYPYPVFKLSKGLNDLIDQLNARASLVLWEREHPDFEEHA